MSERDEGFLGRWSRRKIEARNSRAAEPAPSAAPPKPAQREGAATPAQAPRAQEPPQPLPPLESLTPHSDFAPFMRAGVDPSMKGHALKTLFGDPALYPMDGLDVYIDDYTKPDPLPEGWLEKLNQLATLHGEPRVAQSEREEAAEQPREASSPTRDEAPQQRVEAHESDTSIAPGAEADAKNRGAT